jgi:DNA repair protein RadC
MTNQVKNESTATYSVDRVDEENGIITAALVILAKRMEREHDALTSPELVREYLTVKLAGLEHEVFGAVFLDNRNRVIATEEMFRGTIDGASVYPREVVKAALGHNAAALMLYHNHPSGVNEPSQADIRITERLTKALQLVDIRVLDHLIVGGLDITSFAEKGLL